MGRLRLTVIYASETGTAMDVAEDVCRAAGRRGLAFRLFSADDYPLAELPEEDLVLFTAATTGQGDAPANFTPFWRFLLRKDLPADSLEDVHYGVFGLGDSSYVKYNAVAKRLDKRLADLGGQRLLPVGLGDDQHPLGLYGDFDPWMSKLWTTLAVTLPSLAGVATVPAAARKRPPSLYTTEVVTGGAAEEALQAAERDAAALRERLAPAHGVNRPYMAPVVANRRLTSEEHFQDVRHLELDVSRGLEYTAGDTALVLPRANPDRVRDFLELFALDADTVVRITANAAADDPASGVIRPTGSRTVAMPTAARLGDLFATVLDVQSVPRRHFFELLAHMTDDEDMVERLEELAASTGYDDLLDYATRVRRSITEVFVDFPAIRPPLDYLLDLVPRMRPRAFSIASAPAARPGQLHLAVAVVEYKTVFPLPREGLCSMALSKRTPVGTQLPIWIQPSTLRLPRLASTPVLLICTGTGLAPFRAFIEERAHQRAQDGDATRIGRMALFFGCRSRTTDFLYGPELEAHVASGTLEALHVAFSRDQADKVYVQHKLREQGELVWDYLGNHNASMYLCGSAQQMPKDVREALEEVLMKHGRMTAADAKQYIDVRESRRQYQTETWS